MDRIPFLYYRLEIRISLNRKVKLFDILKQNFGFYLLLLDNIFCVVKK